MALDDLIGLAILLFKDVMNLYVRILKASFLYGLKNFRDIPFGYLFVLAGLLVFLLFQINWSPTNSTVIFGIYVILTGLRLAFNKHFGLVANENIKMIFEILICLAATITFFIVGFDIVPSKDESGAFGYILLYFIKLIVGLAGGLLGFGLSFNGYRFIVSGDRN